LDQLLGSAWQELELSDKFFSQWFQFETLRSFSEFGDDRLCSIEENKLSHYPTQFKTLLKSFVNELKAIREATSDPENRAGVCLARENRLWFKLDELFQYHSEFLASIFYLLD
jgi:hypothetical protein